VRVHRTGPWGQGERTGDIRDTGRVLGGRRDAGPAQRGLARRGGLLQIGLESLRLWHTGFLDGLPDEVVTARESLVVAVDRADTADLRTVGRVAGRPGPSGDRDERRA
jgi:glycine oxidase